jgi:hypothetical protein
VLFVVDCTKRKSLFMILGADGASASNRRFFFLFLMSDNFYLKKRKYSRIFKNSGLFVCALAVSFFLSFLSQSES